MKRDQALALIHSTITGAFQKDTNVILPPLDVQNALNLFRELNYHFKVTMLDPWYNKGVGGQRDDYREYIVELLEHAAQISDHVMLWGFPEIIAQFVERIPNTMTLTAWLTWFYKNNPSVIRGWRSSQMACLHLSRPGATLYPERFLNEKQLELRDQGKLRYMPGPTSVIEAGLLVGFVGRAEQTGHPAQKPEKVYEPIYLMTAAAGDLVLDPMAGSGTTGSVGARLGSGLYSRIYLKSMYARWRIDLVCSD
jgi:site-specific DNA-methyltransferase (adenine-specific)